MSLGSHFLGLIVGLTLDVVVGAPLLLVAAYIVLGRKNENIKYFNALAISVIATVISSAVNLCASMFGPLSSSTSILMLIMTAIVLALIHIIFIGMFFHCGLFKAFLINLLAGIIFVVILVVLIIVFGLLFLQILFPSLSLI